MGQGMNRAEHDWECPLCPSRLVSLHQGVAAVALSIRIPAASPSSLNGKRRTIAKSLTVVSSIQFTLGLHEEPGIKASGHSASDDCGQSSARQIGSIMSELSAETIRPQSLSSNPICFH